MNAIMRHSNEELLAIFESALGQMQTPEEPEMLYAPIIYSMSGGGKRIRPVLLMLNGRTICRTFIGTWMILKDGLKLLRIMMLQMKLLSFEMCQMHRKNRQ